MQAPLVCKCATPREDLAAVDKPTKGNNTLCQGVECVGDKRVGCKNRVEEFRGRRARESNRALLLCSTHIDRIKTHHMCPFCGDFCAHVSCF